jgi:hypothetical protein
MTTIICEFCESCISKHNISKHKKSDTCIKIQNIINKHTISYNLLKCENDTLKNTIYSFEKDIENYKNQIKILEKSSEEYRKIVEKAATKTTVKNYNHNNYLNYISSEPLKLSEVKKQVKSIMNCDTVMLDDNEFNEHIVDNILKDENGKDKVLCTDINRKNFTYKDEKSGQLVCDPELERIREQLRKGADVKSLKKNLLEKLVKEYEDNNNTGIDPYKKFCDIIQKLNFGSPFVDHVAKKTYIKSKNYKDKEQSYSILTDNKITNKESFDEPQRGESFDKC